MTTPPPNGGSLPPDESRAVPAEEDEKAVWFVDAVIGETALIFGAPRPETFLQAREEAIAYIRSLTQALDDTRKERDQAWTAHRETDDALHMLAGMRSRGARISGRYIWDVLESLRSRHAAVIAAYHAALRTTQEGDRDERITEEGHHAK